MVLLHMQAAKQTHLQKILLVRLIDQTPYGFQLPVENGTIELVRSLTVGFVD